MRRISAWLTAVAVPRRAVLVSLTVPLLALGMVSMHATSGSTTSHTTHLAAATHAAPHATTSVPLPDQHATGTLEALGLCADGCDVHEVTSALCLMVLVALLTLTAPRRRLLTLGRRTSWRRIAPATTGGRTAARPSLLALGVSRT